MKKNNSTNRRSTRSLARSNKNLNIAKNRLMQKFGDGDNMKTYPVSIASPFKGIHHITGSQRCLLEWTGHQSDKAMHPLHEAIHYFHVSCGAIRHYLAIFLLGHLLCLLFQQVLLVFNSFCWLSYFQLFLSVVLFERHLPVSAASARRSTCFCQFYFSGICQSPLVWLGVLWKVPLALRLLTMQLIFWKQTKWKYWNKSWPLTQNLTWASAYKLQHSDVNTIWISCHSVIDSM